MGLRLTGKRVRIEDLAEYHEQRERALDYTRERWRQRVGVLRTISVAVGAIMLGGWWAQDPSAREPLSINFNGEQAIAVVGLALLIFGTGAWLGLHLPSEPSKRAERATADEFQTEPQD